MVQTVFSDAKRGWLSGFFAAVLLVVAVPSSWADSYRQIRDWSVSCNSELDCTAVTQKEIDRVYALGFQRDAKADAPLAFFINTDLGLKQGSTILLSVPGQLDGYRLDVDQEPAATGVWRIGRQDMIARLVPALKAGQSLQVQLETDEGNREFEVSLSGMTGAFLNMDDMQQRLERVDALHAIGDKPARDAMTRVSRLSSKAELPGSILAEWTKPANACDDDYSEEPRDLIEDFGGTRVQLSSSDTLFFLPCGGPGAYNLIFMVFAHSTDNNVARSMALPVMGPSGPSVMTLLTNVDWDDRKSRLSHFHKGRGLGDCGSSAVWSFESDSAFSEFVLLEQREKDDCDGQYEEEWPQVWPPN